MRVLAQLPAAAALPPGVILTMAVFIDHAAGFCQGRESAGGGKLYIFSVLINELLADAWAPMLAFTFVS